MEFTLLPTQFDAVHLILLLGLIGGVAAALRKPATPTPAPASPAPETRAPEPAPVAAPQTPRPSLQAHDPVSALQLLGLLQQDARLIDFLQEDLTGYSDADVGVAARVVHDGGRKVLKQYFNLVPVRNESEEERIVLPAGFNPAEVRLTGNVTGQAPFTGTLLHKGWKVAEVSLPQLVEGHDPRIITPAEVEL